MALRRKKFWLFFKFLLGCILLGSAIWFLFFSNYFKITEVKITVTPNNLGISNEKIYSKIKWLKGKNILLVKSEKINQQTKNEFPAIEEIKTKKNFINQKITIWVKTYPIAAIWCQDKKNYCFYLNRQGMAFQKSPLLGGNLFLVINDSSNRDLTVKQTFISKNFLDFILKLNDLLEQNNLSANKFEIENFPIEDLTVWIKNPIKVKSFFDFNLSSVQQVIKLKKTIDEIIQEGEDKNAVYQIDLRIKDKSYWQKLEVNKQKVKSKK